MTSVSLRPCFDSDLAVRKVLNRPVVAILGLPVFFDSLDFVEPPFLYAFDGDEGHIMGPA